MERENALNILKSRQQISGPGKYKAKVTSVTPFHRANAVGADQTHIVNFNIMTPWHTEAAKTLFAQGDIQEAINQNLSSSVRLGDYLPSKGEMVEIVVENVTTKNGVEGLFVTSPCIKINAEAASPFNMDSFLDATEGSSIVKEDIEEETPAFAEKATA